MDRLEFYKIYLSKLGSFVVYDSGPPNIVYRYEYDFDIDDICCKRLKLKNKRYLAKRIVTKDLNDKILYSGFSYNKAVQAFINRHPEFDREQIKHFVYE